MHVNDPIHEVEADKTDRKDDPGILVDVRRRYSHEFTRSVKIVKEGQSNESG